jgi:hypothetical protein
MGVVECWHGLTIDHPVVGFTWPESPPVKHGLPNMHTVTLDLPEDVFRQAQAAARAARRPVAKVLAEWIHPPVVSLPDRVDSALAGLVEMPTEQLIRVARSRLPDQSTRRLHELLDEQQHRDLTLAEQRELTELVSTEDLQTLRKARALLLLKQRGALPDDLHAFLASS